MRRGVAGQKVGSQMVTATDGSAFTGSVTVYVTGDAGTQAVGSVGAGACTHEGNGYHTYAPAQAETNYELVAFTFIGSGAVPASVQIYTRDPRLDRAAQSMVLVTATTGATTTSIPTASADPSIGVADQLKGATIVFDRETTTANLRGARSRITTNTAGGILTVSPALPTAPASGDTAVIL